MTILERRRAMATSEKRIKYGYLYNWYTTQGSGNASITSSDAWSVPLDLNYLINYDEGSFSVIGGWLKSTNSEYWINNVGATDKYKFDARGSGFREIPLFSSLQYHFSFWVTYTDGQAYIFQLGNNYISGGYTQSLKNYGRSIPLFRTATPQDPPDDGDYCLPYIGNDGTSCLTVRIGTQVWTAENLAETKYRNGDIIPNVDSASEWEALTSGALCAYNNEISNVFI